MRRPPVPAHPDAEGVHRVQAERAQPAGHLDRAGGGALLEAVVDGDRAGPEADPGGLEGGGGGQGHGVGPAAAGHQDERGVRCGAGPGGAALGVLGVDVADGVEDRPGVGGRGAGLGAGRRVGGVAAEGVGNLGGDVVQHPAYCQAYRGHCGMRTHG